jgi:hypothetical protein
MKDGKWGLVNDAGKIILNPDYAEIGQFINGMARVSKDNKYGYVNKLGEFVIQLKYAFIGTPNEDGLIGSLMARNWSQPSLVSTNGTS